MLLRAAALALALAGCAHAPRERWVAAESQGAGVRVLLPPGEWTIEARPDGLLARQADRTALVQVISAPQLCRSAAAAFEAIPGMRAGVLELRGGSGHCVLLALSGSAQELAAMRNSLEVVGGAARPTAAGDELEELLRAGKFAEALPRLEALVEGDPSNPHLRYWTGQAALAAGGSHLEAAIRHLEAALAKHRSDVAEGEQGLGERLPQAMEALGIAYSKMNKLDQAADTLGELVVRFPDYGQGFYNFACILALKGDKAGALTNLDRALEEDPELGEHARGDQDFASLQGSPEFEAVLQKHAPR